MNDAMAEPNRSTASVPLPGLAQGGGAVLWEAADPNPAAGIRI